MNRQEFLDLQPTLGHKAEYKIFAFQSDKFISRNDVRQLTGNYYIVIEHHKEACKIVDSLELYRKFMLTDVNTYLRLIKVAPKYIPPFFAMTKSLCAKVLAIRPAFISSISDAYIDTKRYLRYIQESKLKYFSKISVHHFRDKEFLFYCWKRSPKLLLYAKYRNLFNYELLAELDLQYPYLNLRKLYADAVPVYTTVTLTKDILISCLNNRIIPKCRIRVTLYTPDIMERIIAIDPNYMLTDCRIKYVTDELFQKYYLHKIKMFPRYINEELLAMLYEKYEIFYLEYIYLYPIELLHKIMDEHNEYISSVQDNCLISELVAKNIKLVSYVDQNILHQALFP